jgi:hypothetical protein
MRIQLAHHIALGCITARLSPQHGADAGTCWTCPCLSFWCPRAPLEGKGPKFHFVLAHPFEQHCKQRGMDLCKLSCCRERRCLVPQLSETASGNRHASPESKVNSHVQPSVVGEAQFFLQIGNLPHLPEVAAMFLGTVPIKSNPT